MRSHIPHATHVLSSTSTQVSTSSSAPLGQTPTQAPQYPHLNLFILMLTSSPVTFKGNKLWHVRHFGKLWNFKTDNNNSPTYIFCQFRLSGMKGFIFQALTVEKSRPTLICRVLFSSGLWKSCFFHKTSITPAVFPSKVRELSKIMGIISLLIITVKCL